MKRKAGAAAILVAAVFGAGEVWAQCSADFRRMLGVGEVLPLNGRFVLEEMGAAEALPQGARIQAAVLVGEGEEIPLVLEESWKGTFRSFQTVLRPQRALRAGATYELFIPITKDGARWRTVVQVGKVEDRERPVWTGKPTVIGKERFQDSCGPTARVTVAVPVEDVGPVMVRVELRVRDARDALERLGEAVTFFVPVEKGQAVLGHGMCLGSFELEPKVAYVATLTAVDLAGNEAAAPGAAIEFVGPVEK